MAATGDVKLLKIKCPRCGTLTNWTGNAVRPFCSSRCRLIDLGRWADETYRIPAGNLPPEDSEESHRENED